MPDITATRPAAGAPIETAWGQQINDAIEGLQSGTLNVAMGGTAAATGAVTFPRAYTAPPIVVAVAAWVSGQPNPVVSFQGVPTATAVTFRVSTMTGATSSATHAVHWMAIGTLATPG